MLQLIRLTEYIDAIEGCAEYENHDEDFKDLILTYLDKVPKSESAEGYLIFRKLEEIVASYLEYLNTRQLLGKLWKLNFEDIVE